MCIASDFGLSLALSFGGCGFECAPQDKYFIIVCNLFGNGASSSPSNIKAPYDRNRYPAITCRDNVRMQAMLMDSLGIDQLALVRTALSMFLSIAALG